MLRSTAVDRDIAISAKVYLHSLVSLLSSVEVSKIQLYICMYIQLYRKGGAGEIWRRGGKAQGEKRGAGGALGTAVHVSDLLVIRSVTTSIERFCLNLSKSWGSPDALPCGEFARPYWPRRVLASPGPPSPEGPGLPRAREKIRALVYCVHNFENTRGTLGALYNPGRGHFKSHGLCQVRRFHDFPRSYNCRSVGRPSPPAVLFKRCAVTGGLFARLAREVPT